ncbi:hypothetical protein [Desulfitobacterium dehalogenans]|uniref:hypothetical protein n=1 Tax=Desulfitobacterium dehalogenans TaxID=36854 RepID=UPI001FA7A5FC|nr:hypothetical protein [Desulfitobacterium dehalogenans]
MRTLQKYIRGLLCLGLILVMVSAIAGCAQHSEGKTDTENVLTDNKPIIVEITDPAELEHLWQEYIYDAIYTIGSTWEFHSAQEIDPAVVAQFCWVKYQEENDTANLKTVSEENMSLLFPLADALKYAERYFNLTTLEVSKIPNHYFNPEKQAFVLGKNSEKPKPGYAERNSWGVHPAKVTRGADGTLTVELEHYDTYENRRVDSRQTFTLKERPNGSLYFVEGRREFINNHLVALTGDVKDFPAIDGFDGDLQEIYMVGEVEGKLLLSYTPNNENQSPALMLLNPDNMKIEKKVNLKGSINGTEVEYKGGRLVVRFKDKVLIYRGDLEVENEIPLPGVITAKIDREPQYDQNGFSEVYFGGYDIASDLNRIVYSDEIGVKLVTLEDGKETLLAKTVQPKLPEPSRGAPVGPSYHFSPRFVAGDRKIITTLTGYEWTSGFTFCDLEEGTSRTYDIITEGSFATGAIRYDTGLLFVNEYWPDESVGENNRKTDQYKTFFLDFHTGKVTEIEIGQPGDTGYIRSDHQCYVGQDFAAFVTSKRSGGDRANDRHYLNRIKLETLEPEQEIVSITAAEPHILGVMADGRIVFWYQFNLEEKGICITSTTSASRE